MTVIANHADRLTHLIRNVVLLEAVSYEKLQSSYQEYLAEHHRFEASVARRLADLAQPDDAPWKKTVGGWAAEAKALNLKPGVSPNAQTFPLPPGFPPRVPWDRIHDPSDGTYYVYTAPEATLTIYL